jgi:hypothetical protein
VKTDSFPCVSQIIKMLVKEWEKNGWITEENRKEVANEKKETKDTYMGRKETSKKERIKEVMERKEEKKEA